ncbi:MAG TPA: hypothetical protein VLT45_07445 [Kofleriaceae bacterium]|nr:hypothetical protein [Kofleriaceae bacterium]
MLRAALVLVTLATLAARGAAQPALTAPLPPPATPPALQLEVAPALGSTYDGDLYAGLAAAGLYRVNDLLAVHAAVEGATARVVHFAGIDQYEGSQDRFAEVRGGVELRHCVREALCAIGGVDVGYRREHEGAMELSGAEAVARIGLDVGTRRLRFRPTFEGTSTHHGDTGALLLGVGYRF